jgi:hypothetical protein
MTLILAGNKRVPQAKAQDSSAAVPAVSPFFA